MMANVDKHKKQEVILPADATRENIRTVIAKYPDLISFDPSDEKNEMLALKCATDPGVPASARDGWRGVVVGWWVGTYDVPDETTGEIITLPSLVLVPHEGEICRLTGWPCINSWAHLLRVAGPERCALGIRVRVHRRPSGVSGRSYWHVGPDA